MFKYMTPIVPTISNLLSIFIAYTFLVFLWRTCKFTTNDIQYNSGCLCNNYIHVSVISIGLQLTKTEEIFDSRLSIQRNCTRITTRTMHDLCNHKLTFSTVQHNRHKAAREKEKTTDVMKVICLVIWYETLLNLRGNDRWTVNISRGAADRVPTVHTIGLVCSRTR